MLPATDPDCDSDKVQRHWVISTIASHTFGRSASRLLSGLVVVDAVAVGDVLVVVALSSGTIDVALTWRSSLTDRAIEERA